MWCRRHIGLDLRLAGSVFSFCEEVVLLIDVLLVVVVLKIVALGIVLFVSVTADFELVMSVMIITERDYTLT